MANITQELQDILDARYGKEVRGSIHDAIDKINKVSEVVLSIGTAVTSSSSSSTGFYVGSLYLNESTKELWKCTGTNTWQSQGILNGEDGVGISSIAKTGQSGIVDTYTITLTNGRTSTFTVTNGASSLTASSSKSGKVTTVKIKNSETQAVINQFTVNDGENGSGLDEINYVYDNGFATRNLCINVLNAYIDVNSHTIVSNANARVGVFYGKANKNYILSASNFDRSIVYKFTNKPAIGSTGTLVFNQQGKTNFTATESCWYAWYCSTANVTNIQIEEGTVVTTYQPYAKSNTELTNDVKYVLPRSEQAVLGAKNMLENTAHTATANGTTWTVNSDKTITTSGLAEANNTLLVNTFTFKAGVSYILSGTPDGGGNSPGVFVRANNNDYSVQFIAEPEGRIIKLDSDTTLNIQCRVPTGDNTSRTFKPMIRLATDPDDTYVPYAMTNRELTKALEYGTNTITAVSGKSAVVSPDTTISRIGNIICLACHLKDVVLNAGTYETLATLPEGYRPKVGVYGIIGGSSTYTVGFRILTNGNIQAYYPSALSNVHLSFNVTYISE